MNKYFLFMVVSLLSFGAAAPVTYADNILEQFIPAAVLNWPKGRVEVTNGTALTANSWFGYGGVTVALHSPAAREGFRLLLAGGSGQYTYETTRGTIDGGKVKVEHQGQKTLGNAMLGYQVNRGPLWLKAYLGGTYEEHKLLPEDPDNSHAGARFGGAGLIEAWLNLGEKAWLSADALYSTVNNGYAASLRLGWRPFDLAAFGPEAGTFRDDALATMRAGGFLKLYVDGREITLSGGYAGGNQDDWTPYAAVNIYQKF